MQDYVSVVFCYFILVFKNGNRNEIRGRISYFNTCSFHIVRKDA